MRLKSYVVLLCTAFRATILKLMYGNKIVFEGHCYIKPRTKIVVGKGKMHWGKSVSVEGDGYITTSTGGKLKIGAHTFINMRCYISCRKTISIGENCIIGPNVSIYDHNHRFEKEKIYKNDYRCSDVVIENGCWIGDGAKILKGSTIGTGSIVGAGVVVSSTIPPHSIVKNGEVNISTIH